MGRLDGLLEGRISSLLSGAGELSVGEESWEVRIEVSEKVRLKGLLLASL
jgi:hypothetical protein